MKNKIIFRILFKLEKIAREALESLICLIQILFESNLTLYEISTNKKRDLYVLGTGPSLINDIHILDCMHRSEIDVMCVNDFYKSKLYKIINPDHYVIADPDYWNDSLFDSVSKDLIEDATNILSNIKFWIPVKAKGSRLDIELKRKKSSIVYYNSTSLGGGRFFKSVLFGKKLAMPRPQNVLVAAISIGIWMGSKKINLLGADHDWHKDISVSVDSELQIRNNHAYEGGRCFKPFYKPSKGKINEKREVFTVSEIFQAWATVHRSYEDLQVLSQRFAVIILNRSSNSFIDAFERKI